jgi:putative Mg2+ transporter-C (MgtC) family protein
MSTSLPWPELIQRLSYTLLAGALIGLNRWERGRAAGLRTTVLVSLAASIAMIQTNLLLGTVGKAADSFIVMDPMRLPLGILSGMGFIGAGVILRRGQMVVGITTAATLWFATVMGLCFGGGQVGIGLTALVLALIVLWGFRWIENQLWQERSGTLTLTFNAASHLEKEIQSYFAGLGFRVATLSLWQNASECCRLRCEIRWKALPKESVIPRFVRELADRADIASVAWTESGPTEI